MSRVYGSLPLTGPSAPAGREVLLGMRLAHARRGSPVELRTFDSFAPDRDAQAAANARAAAADDDVLAYIGDFHSSQVLASAPILGGAGLLQVAPVATFTGLHGETLVRLWPHDGIGAAAIASWLQANSVSPVLVVHDYGDEYGAARLGRPAGARLGRGAHT